MTDPSADDNKNADTPRGDDRLDSWKRIASYLRRGVRTVRRWESEEGLPVHRHPHKSQGSVYAYKSEIDTWLDSRSSSAGKQKSGQVAMLAVLPFENLSGDPEKEFFSDGLTEEVISQLGQVQRSDLGVIARTSIMIYKGARKSIKEIAEELRVHYILEGSVRTENDIVRVTAQLIRVHDQTHIWAHSYEEPLDNVLRLQRDLSHGVATEIRKALHISDTVQTERPAADSRNIKPETHAKYLQARYLLYRMIPDSLIASVDCFQQVMDTSPDFAPAFAGQAEALQLMTLFCNLAPTETMPRALESASRAVSIDPDCAEAYAALGLIHYCYTWDWEAAENAFRRAIALNPSLSSAHQWYAEFLSVVQRFAEAHQSIERARQLDPLSLAVATSHGHVLWLEYRPQDVIASMTRVIEMEPHYPLAHILLGLAYAQLDQFNKAEAVFVNAESDCGPSDFFAGMRSYAAARAGRLDEAHKQFARVEQMAAERYVPRFISVMHYVGIGKYEAALDHLEATIDERAWHVTILASDSMFDPLRDEPRFQAILRKLKLPESLAR